MSAGLAAPRSRSEPLPASWLPRLQPRRRQRSHETAPAAKFVTQASSRDDKEGVRNETDPMSTPARSPRAGQPLSRKALELTAERLRVIAEPNRIALLEALNEGEASVQELADRLLAHHQKVSKHLAVLYGAGMVSRRRGEGTTVRYALIDWSGWWVIEQIARWVQAGLAEDGEAEQPDR